MISTTPNSMRPSVLHNSLSIRLTSQTIENDFLKKKTVRSDQVCSHFYKPWNESPSRKHLKGKEIWKIMFESRFLPRTIYTSVIRPNQFKPVVSFQSSCTIGLPIHLPPRSILIETDVYASQCLFWQSSHDSGSSNRVAKAKPPHSNFMLMRADSMLLYSWANIEVKLTLPPRMRL